MTVKQLCDKVINSIGFYDEENSSNRRLTSIVEYYKNDLYNDDFINFLKKTILARNSKYGWSTTFMNVRKIFCEMYYSTDSKYSIENFFKKLPLELKEPILDRIYEDRRFSGYFSLTPDELIRFYQLKYNDYNITDIFYIIESNLSAGLIGEFIEYTQCIDVNNIPYNNEGATPLIHAIVCNLSMDLIIRSKDKTMLTLEETPLLEFMHRHNDKIINKPNCKTGKTPLMYAVIKNDIDTVKQLIEFRAEVEAKCQKGYDALLYAAAKGHKEVTKYLLEQGAKLTSSNTPYIIKTLTNNSSKDNFEIVSNNDFENLSYLISVGFEINVKNSSGVTLLMIAVQKNSSKIFELLLNNGININAQDNKGRSALFFGIGKGHNDLVIKLLNNKADINLLSHDNGTFLNLAIGKNNIDIVRELLKKGANINLKDGNGDTPLDVALKNNNMEIVILLKENGANIEGLEKIYAILNGLEDQKGPNTIKEPIKASIVAAKHGMQDILDTLAKSNSNIPFKKVVNVIKLSGYNPIELEIDSLIEEDQMYLLTYRSKSKEYFEFKSKQNEIEKVLQLSNTNMYEQNGQYIIEVYKDTKEAQLIHKLKIDDKKPVFKSIKELNHTTYIFFEPINGVPLSSWEAKSGFIEDILKMPIEIEEYDESHNLYDPSFSRSKLIVIKEHSLSVLPDALNLKGEYLKSTKNEKGYQEYHFKNTLNINDWKTKRDQIIEFLNKRVDIIENGTIVILRETIEEMIPKLLDLKNSNRQYPKLFDVQETDENKTYFYTFMPEVNLNVWKENSRKTNFRTLFNEPQKVYKLELYDSTHTKYDSKFYDGQLIMLHEDAKIPNKEELVNVDIINSLQKDKIFWGYGSGSKKYYTDINDTTHTMLIGASGSGKSNMMNGIILSLLHNIDKVDKLYLFDLKDGLEFSMYQDLDSDKVVVFGEDTRPTELLQSILEVEAQMRLRNQYIKDIKAKKLTNNPIYFIIDEFAAIENMTSYTREDDDAKDEIFRYLTNLAKQARSANIKIFAQSQKPNDIIKSGIAEQLASRVLLKTPNDLDVDNTIPQYKLAQEYGINHTKFDLGRCVFEDHSSGTFVLDELQFPYIDPDKNIHLNYKSLAVSDENNFTSTLTKYSQAIKEKFPHLANTQVLGGDSVEAIDNSNNSYSNENNSFSSNNEQTTSYNEVNDEIADDFITDDFDIDSLLNDEDEKDPTEEIKNNYKDSIDLLKKLEMKLEQ